MSNEKFLVSVYDSDGQIVEKVLPAVARYAISNKYATVRNLSPYSITLDASLAWTPRPGTKGAPFKDSAGTDKGTTCAEAKEGNSMTTKTATKTKTPLRNPAQSMLDIVKFFDKVDSVKSGGDDLVWVRATEPHGYEVILELKDQGERIRIPPIRPGSPVCLSEFASLDVLRKSQNLKACVTGGSLKLLTQDEAMAFFTKKGAALKMTPEELIEKKRQADTAFLNSEPIEGAEPDENLRIRSDRKIIDQDELNPRILQLASEVHVLLKDEQRLPVQDVMTVLLELEDLLTLDDLEFCASGQLYYPTIKKWAQKKMQEVAEASGLMPETDDLSD